MKLILLINIRMLVVVDILIFISKINFVHCRVEYKKRFYDHIRLPLTRNELNSVKFVSVILVGSCK